MSKTDIDNNIPLEQNAPTSYALSGKIMLSAIVILFAVVVFMIALHIYARWYLLRVRRLHLHRRRARRQRASHIVFYVDPNSTTANRGLDAALLTSLPVFVYSSSTHPETLDCAVCLSEFEENEAGRVLPKCHHSFHTDCIDMWFRSHSTCPICRAPVETPPVQPVQIRNSDFAEAHELSGSSSGVCSMCNPPNQTEGEKINTTSLADRRKGLDLAGVKNEVPRRRTESFDELRLSSPASLGFRSPGNRLQSLKRILSMGKKPAANSPSSGTGTSCVTAEFDVELGRGESTYGQTRTPTPR